MKKIYTAPVLAISGDTVRETLGGPIVPAPESQTTKLSSAGAIGYYL